MAQSYCPGFYPAFEIHREVISPTCNTAGKAGMQIERCVISTFKSPRAWVSGVTFASGRICCGSEIDHGKLSRPIPSAAGERHQTVLLQIVNLDYRRCVSPDL